MRALAILSLLLLPLTAAAEWRVEKDAGSDSYGVYEDGQRRGSLQRDSDSGMYNVLKEGAGPMGRAEKNTALDSFTIGGVRQDPGAASFGVFDQAGNRIGTFHPSH